MISRLAAIRYMNCSDTPNRSAASRTVRKAPFRWFPGCVINVHRHRVGVPEGLASLLYDRGVHSAGKLPAGHHLLPDRSDPTRQAQPLFWQAVRRCGRDDWAGNAIAGLPEDGGRRTGCIRDCPATRLGRDKKEGGSSSVRRIIEGRTQSGSIGV